MTRKLSCILFSSASILLGLSACSSEDKELPSTTALSACDGNQVGTGGYIWTYTDAANNTYATVDPFTTWDEAAGTGNPFTVTPDPEEASNNVCRITGNKPDGQQADELDTCGDKPLYPVAGVGFSFKDKNETFSVCDKLGIRFRARGQVVGESGTPDAVLRVRVAFPTIETDIWQPGDKWAASKEGQTCTCDHNKPEGTSKTCFGFYGKDIEVAPAWQWYSITWGELGTPSWAGETPFNPTNILKAQFGIESTGQYQLDVDDIQFITTAGDAAWCGQPNITWANITPTDPAFCTLAEPTEPLCNPGQPVEGERL